MKHLKAFENKDIINPPLYKIGDYVYYWMQISKKKINTGKVKILDIEYVDSIKEYSYLVHDGVSNDKQLGNTGSIISSKFYVLEGFIKRLLTEKEIENFEILKNANKYNI